MRSRAIGAAVLLAACLVLPAEQAHAEPVGDATLEVSSPAAVPWGTVTVTGSCPGEVVSSGAPDTESPDTESPAAATTYPGSTVLRIDGADIEAEVPLTEGRFSQPLRVPLDVAPQEYQLSTGCGGTVPFTVLEPGLLAFAPDRAEPGDEVVVTGTCWLFHVRLPSPASIDLAGDGRWILGPLLLDTATGLIAASTVTVPDDVPPGRYTGTSNCDTTADLEVLARSTRSDPPTPPRDDRVVVPTLLGLSREDAEAALGDQLRVGDVSGGGGEVVRQDPLPGEQVPRGSAVDLELRATTPTPDDDGPASFPLLPVAGGGSLLLLVLLGAPLTAHGRRVRRQRRWVDRSVDVAPGAPRPRPAAGPPPAVRGLDVRIEVRRNRTRPQQGGPLP